MSPPRASILIPTREGEGDLETLLPVLAAQELEGGFEIRAIDSDSRDTTRQLLRRHGVEVRWIDRAEFGHGRTRNELARRAHGDVLAFLSQDALPADSGWLAALLEPFSDPAVAAVQSRILPHPDQDALTTRTALALPEAHEDLPPAAPGDVVFNNVASAIRASVLRELPFPEVPFGEDWAWAREALAVGHRIAFAPRAVVYHAHRYEPEEAYRRYSIDARFQRCVRGVRVRAGFGALLRGIVHELREDLRFVRATGAPLAELGRAPGLRAAQVFGQFVGSREWPWSRELDNSFRRVGRAERSESTVTPRSPR